MSKDDEQLRLLGIFHNVVALFAGLFALMPLMHVGFGIGMVTGILLCRGEGLRTGVMLTSR